MGRTARNEALKLRATYFNNIAVGAFTTGLIVPFLTLAHSTADGAPLNLREILTIIFVILLGGFVSLLARYQASRTISKLED